MRKHIAIPAAIALTIGAALTSTPAHADIQSETVTLWWLTPASASQSGGINSAYPQRRITGASQVPCGRTAQVDTYTGSPDVIAKLPTVLDHFGADQLPGLTITPGNHGSWWYTAPACHTFTHTVQVDREQVTGSAWFASRIAAATSDGVLRQGELKPYVWGTAAAKKHVKETARFVTVTIHQAGIPTTAQWLDATSKATGLALSPAKVGPIAAMNSDTTYVWTLAPGSDTRHPFVGGPQQFVGATASGTASGVAHTDSFGGGSRRSY